MTWILAIDPGQDSGWALGTDGGLQQFGLGRTPRAHLVTPGTVEPHHCIIEMPRVYPRGKARPNDLLTLAVNVGQHKERAEQYGWALSLVYPRDWKGTLDPDVLCNRTEAKLSVQQRGTLAKAGPTGKLHNVLDAIALYEWARGRLRLGLPLASPPEAKRARRIKGPMVPIAGPGWAKG